MFSRKALVDEGRRRWEGKRVAFVLPVREAGGGGNVVITESRAMQKFGVNVCLINFAPNMAGFRSSYPNLEIPVAIATSDSNIAEVAFPRL